MLSVPVSVSDGLLTSNIFNVAISVSSVNDPPVIIGQTTLTINEETPLTIVLTDLVVSDNDNTYPGDFTLDVMSGENYSVAGATITPAAEFSGALNVPVTVNDGSSSSAVFNLQVTVVPVNDAPVITDQAPLSIAEDQPFVFDLAYLTVSDPDNTYPNDFSLSISPGSNYTVNGSTITPQADFTGALGVPVAVSDGLNLSNTFNVQITVNPSDDAPVITGQQTVQVNEDESINISISHLVVSDPDNPGVEGLTITLQPGTNYTVSGTTVTPSQNLYFQFLLRFPTAYLQVTLFRYRLMYFR
jgi:VCBS repeat-containing protein